jgi:uncharacterized repeat protein (TIGR03803 family)
VNPLLPAKTLVLLAGFSTLVIPTHAQYKVMANFPGDPGLPLGSPVIAQSRGGYLVTTSLGSTAERDGQAFRMSTTGALTDLHEFVTNDGEVVAGGLNLGRDGLFYGSALYNGPNNGGTVFQMTATGNVTVLHSFSEPGGNPQASPVQSLYGDFYGTTYGDDNDPGSDAGTVYKIDSAGNFTLLHTLSAYTEGANPSAPLVQDSSNFWFYGVAEHGGPNSVGSIFRIDSKGDFEVLHLFNDGDGGYPVSLIQASDGNFYGSTYLGGQYNQGGVFKMDAVTHQVTVLHNFTGGSDGGGGSIGFLQASDGYLYGLTANGGSAGGTLFRMSTSGSDFKVLHTFEKSSGYLPNSLMQDTNGFLYGETCYGGTSGWGVFFRYDLGLPEFVSFLGTYGRVGMTVDLLGQNFTSDSQVLFNGVPAQVIEVEPNFMKVTVPEGATTGWITVTTSKGIVKSNKPFLVRP